LPNTLPQYIRRIGLLGGSFNPPHEGHREISLAALDRLCLDAVWWLVTPGNPLKDASVYAPFDQRMRDAQRAANHEDIVVSDFETRHSLQYTVDTIERLRLLNPEVKFVWLMGADGLLNFHRWKDWERIATLAPIAVFNRPGYGADALVSEAASSLGALRLDAREAAKLADAEPPAWIFFADMENPLSSTAIRGRRQSKDTPSA